MCKYEKLIFTFIFTTWSLILSNQNMYDNWNSNNTLENALKGTNFMEGTTYHTYFDLKELMIK
jgi:hypothetical protein